MKLDDLYFDVIFRDSTKGQIEKMKKNLQKMSDAFVIDPKINAQNLQKSLKKASEKSLTIYLKKATLTKEAMTSLQKSLDSNSWTLKNVRFSKSSFASLEQQFTQSVKNAMAKIGKETSGGGGNDVDKATNKIDKSIDLIKKVFMSGVAVGFIKNLTSAIGMFEQQLVALQSMLASNSKGAMLFNQIKSFAVRSPFQFPELVSFTKQLTAFQIPYNEIFDTTKRLADMSAGLGVDMGRLILAYGQVRSAEYLRGQEVRQFTEAGVPLLQKLADKFSELEHRVVSVGEVFDYVSRRKVPFAMVKSVIEEMTNKGGIFYNMQEKQADTLAGKVKNLSDAYNIFLYEIGRSGAKSVLGFFVDILKYIMRCKDTVIALGAALVTAFSVYTAQAFVNNLGKIITKLRAANLFVGGWASLISGAIGGIAIAIWNATKENDRLREELKKTAEETTKEIEQLQSVAGDIKISVEVNGGNKLKTLEDGLEKINEFSQDGEGILYAVHAYKTEDIDKALEVVESEIKSLDKVNLALRKIADAGVTSNVRSWTDLAKYDLGNTLEEYTEAVRKYNKALSDYDSLSNFSKKLLPDRATFANNVSYYKQTTEDLNEVLEMLKENIDNVAGGLIKSMDVVSRNQYVNKQIDQYAVGNEKLSGENAKIVKMYLQFKYNANEEEILDKSSTALNVIMGKVKDIATEKGFDLKKAFEKSAFLTPEERKKAEAEMVALYKVGVDRSIEELPRFRNEFLDMLKALEKTPFTIHAQVALGNAPTQINNPTQSLMEMIARWNGIDLSQKKLPSPMLDPRERVKETEEYKYLSQFSQETSSMADEYARLNNELKKIEEELKRTPEKETRFNEKIEDLKKHREWIRRTMSNYGWSPDDERSGRGKSHTDEALKAEKERYAILKKYIQEYQKLVKLYGEEEAAKKSAKNVSESRVLNRKEFLNAMGGNLDFKDQIKLAENYLAFSEKNMKGTGDRQKFVEELRTWVNGIKADDEAKKLSDSLELLNKEIERYTKKWGVYDKMLSATGNEATAKQFAFGNNITYGKQSEQLAEQIKTALGSKMRLPIEQYKDMGDNELTNLFGEDGAKLIQKYFKMIEDEQDKIIDNLITAIDKSKDLDTTIKGIEKKYADMISEARSKNLGDGVVNNLRKQQAEETAKAKWDNFKTTPQYAQMFDDLGRLGYNSLKKLYEVFSDMKPETEADASSLKELMNALKKIREEIEQRNPFKTISDALKNLRVTNGITFDENGNHVIANEKEAKLFGKKKGETITKDDVENTTTSSLQSLQKGIEGVSKGFSALSSALDPVTKLLDSLGLEDISEAISDVTETISGAISAISSTQSNMNTLVDLANGMGATGIGKALGQASPYISAAMSAVSIVGSLFTLHDKALQKHIEYLKREEKKAQAVYELIETRLKYTLGKGYGMDTKKGYSEGTTYRSQRENLQSQYYLKQQQLADERKKKKKDKDAIADLEAEVLEAKEAILQYSQDLASELFSINIEDWASQIGDSLINAFAEGSSAADAFNNTVADMLKNVVKNMAQLYILEPAMKDLQKYLFGEDGMGGVFGKDLTLSRSDVEGMIPILANLKTSIGNVKELYDAIKEAAAQSGIDLSGTTSGLSAGIQSITEDTADLLASYLNAIRARLMLQGSLLDVTMPVLQEISEAQLRELQSITINTMRNAEAAERIETAISGLVTVGSNGKQMRVKVY